jgi:hypothetical protein
MLLLYHVEPVRLSKNAYGGTLTVCGIIKYALSKEDSMSKENTKQKPNAKKKAQHTLKEKRQAKKEKAEAKTL